MNGLARLMDNIQKNKSRRTSQFVNKITFYSVILFFVLSGVILLYSIWMKGDTIDFISYPLFLIIIYGLFLIFKRRGLNTGIVLLTLFCSLNLVFLDSLNKVDGYPDKELAFGLFLFAILLYHFWMLFLFIKYGKKYSTLIATNLLVLYLSSFVLLPISIIRQFVASKTVKEISTQEKKNTRILYFTKILSNTAYAIGRKEYSDGDYDVVLVFHFEGQYVYDRTLWLVSGQGSMDAQIPNQSKIYQKGSEYFLKYFGRP